MPVQSPLEVDIIRGQPILKPLWVTFRHGESLQLSLLAAPLGILCGYAAVLLIHLIQFFQNLFIHQLDQLKPKGKKNPYTEYFTSPNQHIWYKYGLINPEPEKIIRHVTFEDLTAQRTIRIGNVVQYITRVRPLSDYAGKQ